MCTELQKDVLPFRQEMSVAMRTMAAVRAVAISQQVLGVTLFVLSDKFRTLSFGAPHNNNMGKMGNMGNPKLKKNLSKKSFQIVSANVGRLLLKTVTRQWRGEARN